MKNLTRILVMAALGLLTLPAAYGNEGADAYPNGVESWQVGSLPPSGLYFINYSIYYSGQLKDGTGANVKLSGGTPAVDAMADAVRTMWVSDRKIWGADFGAYLVLAGVDQRVNLNGRRGMSGIGDAAFSPFVLGGHGKNWNWVASVELDAPLAHFDKNDPRVSLGTNYWSYQPHVGISFLPKSGWEATGKFMYNLNAADASTRYRSGQNFHFDYVAGKHLGRWSLGASGYVLKQMTNDTVNGQAVTAIAGLYDTGRRGQALAVGPSVKYESKSHIGFVVQYGHEALVRNRFGGDKLVFRMIVPAGWFKAPGI
jgi:hypothetical protein